jgi:hypothetical protein
VRFQAGEMEIRPFEVIEDLATGDLAAEVWRLKVEHARISGLLLGGTDEGTS